MGFGKVSMLTGLITIAMVSRLYDHINLTMDEIFHIPQAQLICNKNFHTWDSKITTFPGLYYFSIGMKLLVSSVFQVECSVRFLRHLNHFLGYLLLDSCVFVPQIEPSGFDKEYFALWVFFYPLILFYSFLYYTDTISLLSVVASYYFSLNRISIQSAHIPASRSSNFICGAINTLMSSAAIFSRQTNVVWIVFFAGTAALARLEVMGYFRDNELSISNILNFLWSLVRYWPCWASLPSCWGPVLPVMGFVAFVFHNGSIVLGDKENHQPVIHLSMPLHLFAVCAAITLPLTIVDVWHLMRSYTTSNRVDQQRLVLEILSTPFGDPMSWAIEEDSETETAAGTRCNIAVKKAFGTTPKVAAAAALDAPGSFKRRVAYLLLLHAIGCCIVTAALRWSCLSHPFLLADNRLVLGPVYYCAAVVTLERLRRRRGPVWLLAYLAAVGLTLVPTPLLEPRYFTPALVVALLNNPPINRNASPKSYSSAYKVATIVSILACGTVSAVTIAVFLFRPFTWHDGSVARFMF